MQYLAMYNSNPTRQENSNVPTGVAFYQAYLHPSVISTHQKNPISIRAQGLR